MHKHGSTDDTDALTSRYAKRARLQALLFTRAASGTATLEGTAEPKLPPFYGE